MHLGLPLADGVNIKQEKTWGGPRKQKVKRVPRQLQRGPMEVCVYVHERVHVTMCVYVVGVACVPNGEKVGECWSSLSRRNHVG